MRRRLLSVVVDTYERRYSMRGYHASVFCLWIVGSGLDVTPEDSIGHDRVDVAVRHGRMCLFEFHDAPAGWRCGAWENGYGDGVA